MTFSTIKLPIDAEAFILSGGEASRAGGINKSFMIVNGRTIIEQQLERMRPVFGERITIVGDKCDHYTDLQLACVPDLHFGGDAEKTALRGIASALRHSRAPWIFLMASDMPWPDMAILEKMCAAVLDEASMRVVGLRNAEGGPQPFHTLLAKELESSAIETLRAGTDLSLKTWLGRHPSKYFSAEDMNVPVQQVVDALENFNSPPDG